MDPRPGSALPKAPALHGWQSNTNAPHQTGWGWLTGIHGIPHITVNWNRVISRLLWRMSFKRQTLWSLLRLPMAWQHYVPGHLQSQQCPKFSKYKYSLYRALLTIKCNNTFVVQQIAIYHRHRTSSTYRSYRHHIRNSSERIKSYKFQLTIPPLERLSPNY